MRMQKHQIPSSKLQRNSKLQTSKLRCAICRWMLVLGAWCFSGYWMLDVGASDDFGSGPQISVPKNLPPDLAHALPKPNWIDQSQAAADLKSRGCLECHAASSPCTRRRMSCLAAQIVTAATP